MGLSGLEGMFGGAVDLANLPSPAVGWPLFLALGVVYFAMAYLLLGSIFLTVGSLAKTVREVQTLSMPVTMLQVFLFLFATLAVARPGRPARIVGDGVPVQLAVRDDRARRAGRSAVAACGGAALAGGLGRALRSASARRCSARG